jgi:hypothetical protein
MNREDVIEMPMLQALTKRTMKLDLDVEKKILDDKDTIMELGDDYWVLV